MPTIGEMVSGTAAITVQFHAITVKAEYYPGKLTESVIAQINELTTLTTQEEVASGFSTMNDLLVELIASWDLTENDGVTMFPIDAARLPELPLPFRMNLLMETVSDMRPN